MVRRRRLEPLPELDEDDAEDVEIADDADDDLGEGEDDAGGVYWLRQGMNRDEDER